MIRLPVIAFASAAGLLPAASSSDLILRSGAVEYRLIRDKGIALGYFGPTSSAPADGTQPFGYDLAGLAEGQLLAPDHLDLSSQSATADEVNLVYRHRLLPLRIEATYTRWGDTGVFTRALKVVNAGDRPIHIESLPELSWRLPKGGYELTYLYGGWGQEMQPATERLGAGRRAFDSGRGRSTSMYSPWFALRNTTTAIMYVAQFAWSGNWQMSFEHQPASANTPIDQTDLLVSLGTKYDFGGPLTLPAKSERALPQVAFTATVGTLDEAANQMHRYQRRYVFPKSAANNPLVVQFNSWYPFPGKPTIGDMKQYAGIAAELGAEAFVLDSGWYNRTDWSAELGDYQVNHERFPNGLEELSKFVREKKMKFGIWVEIENAGKESAVLKLHPDWFLPLNGGPKMEGVRAMLNFANSEVRAWAHSVVDRLVKDYRLGWIKIDYNVDIGDRFDPTPLSDRSGTVLADHVVSYYRWLDEVRAKHPDLIVENCSSGALRFDLGIMAHTHTSWVSDVVAPRPSLQLAYGCTLEFSPEVCNHWAVGDGEGDRAIIDNNAPQGWWNFVFRVPMNGQFGLSSRVAEWSPDLRKRAAENITLYKHIRRTIAGADVYHLTPPPSHNDPQDWMAVQYVSEDRKRSVLMAYRLRNGAPIRVWKLEGLDPESMYQVSIDGQSQPAALSGRDLISKGLPVRLEDEWRAAVLELEAVAR